MVPPLVLIVVVRPGTTLDSEATSVTPWFCSRSAETATIVMPTSESACWRFCAVTTISCNSPAPARDDASLGASDAPLAAAADAARSSLDHSAQMLNAIGQTHRTYITNPLVLFCCTYLEDAAPRSRRMQCELFGCFDTSKGGPD